MELQKPKPFQLHPQPKVLTSNPRGFSFHNPNPGVWLNNDVPEYEPKFQNRFLLIFPPELGINSCFVYPTSRPSFRINHDFGDPFRGGVVRYEWDDITIKLRDPIDPPIAQNIYEVLINQNRIETTLRYKLQLLGPAEDIVEQWVITGQIISVNFGELSYDSDELSDIEIVIHPHYCILEF